MLIRLRAKQGTCPCISLCLWQGWLPPFWLFARNPISMEDVQADTIRTHAYPVGCQVGNMPMYFPLFMAGLAPTFSAFGTQPDKHVRTRCVQYPYQYNIRTLGVHHPHTIRTPW